MTHSHDDLLRRDLRRHRAFATLLLLLMAGLLVLAYSLPPSWNADLLAAAAKAGVVGGLADWFAVSALFRRPLGLPIPHTAIIPNQKARLGDGLGRFVANHVFTPDQVARVVTRLDVAAILGRFLAERDSARPAAQALASGLPKLMGTVEDGRAGRVVARFLPRVAGGPWGAQVVARALRALVAGGRHQAVFDLLLEQVKGALSAKEDQLREALRARVRDAGGAVLGWAAGGYLANRILAAINAELAKVEPGDSDLRAAFEAWIESEIRRIETDPERAAQIGRAIRGALAHPAVREWLGDAWGRLRLAVEADAANPEGRSVALIEGALANIGCFLLEDADARARLHAAVERALAAFLPAAQSRLAEFIGDVVKGWDAREITEKIELRVGRDLQFVRVNGTLVGFLAGGALFILLDAVFGRVAH
jgi:uncharacterized membrane-anchored protein YjiN (DUF445 family)